VSQEKADIDDNLGSPLRRNIVWLFFQRIAQMLFTIYFRFRCRGLERLPATGGALLLSNHQSFLDPLLIGLPLPRPISYLARDTLFRVPVVGWILRHTYVMPLNRDGGTAAGIREPLRRMERGFLVGIFPEGTRSADGKMGPLKPGFAALLRRTTLPVYPVGVAGAKDALGRRHVIPRPRPVRIVYGTPLSAEKLAELSVRGREEELVEYVRAAIAACQLEAEEWLHGHARFPLP
jgi:1-acyl-sn-glycerol-3-phosphate acyltransferase